LEEVAWIWSAEDHESIAQIPRGALMSTKKSTFWVVYRMTVHGKKSGVNAVCEQGEWDAMELDRPGYHTLVQAGILTEGEAERLARSTSAEGSTGQESAPKLPHRRGTDAIFSGKHLS
jgi:hypothetical protein